MDGLRKEVGQETEGKAWHEEVISFVAARTVLRAFFKCHAIFKGFLKIITGRIIIIFLINRGMLDSICTLPVEGQVSAVFFKSQNVVILLF